MMIREIMVVINTGLIPLLLVMSGKIQTIEPALYVAGVILISFITVVKIKAEPMVFPIIQIITMAAIFGGLNRLFGIPFGN